MDLELKGRVAVVTGCSVGIGRAAASLLAAEGAQTVSVARREHLLATLAHDIEKTGGARPLAIALDLTIVRRRSGCATPCGMRTDMPTSS